MMNNDDLLDKIKIAERDPNGPRFTILKKNHINDTVEIFTKSFCQGEPLTTHLGITPQEFHPFALKVIHKAVMDGLSIVALDKDGKVIGCVVAEDSTNPMLENNFKEIRPIYKFLEALSKPFNEMKFKKNTVVHIWITAVAEDYKGTGLSTMLNNACVALALQKGFSYVIAEFTSNINERHMNRFPDNMKCEMNFKDFALDGEFPFSTLEGTASSYICSAAPYISLREIRDFLLEPSKIADRILSNKG